MTATAAEKLDSLRAAEASAAERKRRAWDARTKEADVSVAAVASLIEYHDAIRFKKREPDAEAQRQLTREFLERVEHDGLVLEAAPGHRGALVARDPAIMAELDDATAALNEARRERREFEAAHADELTRDAKRAEMGRLREALDGDDPAKVREALRV